MGLIVKPKPETENPRRFRGTKLLNYRKTWEQRCKSWLHGTVNKKDPNTGEFLYTSSATPITDRWGRDERCRQSCNEESQKESGYNFTREMALDADEIAQHEKEMSGVRAVEHAQPSHERVQKYDAPLVRSTQAGGSGTRRRVGHRGRSKSSGRNKRSWKKQRQRPWCKQRQDDVRVDVSIFLLPLEQRVTFSFKDLGNFSCCMLFPMMTLISLNEPTCDGWFQ